MSAVIIFLLVGALFLFARKTAFYVLKALLRGSLFCILFLFLSTKLPISVGINPFTAAVCAVFGMPGAVLLYILSVL